MKKNKKKFVDKKKATTFVVVNKERQSKEIKAGEKPTVEHVFMPVRPHNYKGNDWEPKIRLDEDDGWDEEEGDRKAKPQKRGVEGKAGEVGVRIGNFRADDYAFGEYGFPDDGYDYSQHFSMPGGGKWLPAAQMGDVTTTVRNTKNTELMNAEKPKEDILDFEGSKAAVVRDTLEPVEHQFSDADDEKEVLKMLEDSVSAEEGWELADDFIATAMDAEPGNKSKSEGKGVRFADANFEDDEDEDSDYKFEDADEYNEDGDDEFPDDVIQFEERRDGSSMMDGWLDHMMDNEYNEDRDPENPNVPGAIDVNDMADYFSVYLEKKNMPSHTMYRDGTAIDEEERQKTLLLAKQALERKEEKVELETVVRDDQWDCESILSTYSNVANHPKVLIDEELKKKKKTQKKERAPVKFRDAEEMEREEEKELEKKKGEKKGEKEGEKKKKDDNVEKVTEQNQNEEERSEEGSEEGSEEEGDEGERSDGKKKKGNRKQRKEETLEEKKARKAMVKEERRKNRETKKALKNAYKNETIAQKKAVNSASLHKKTVISL